MQNALIIGIPLLSFARYDRKTFYLYDKHTQDGQTIDVPGNTGIRPTLLYQRFRRCPGTLQKMCCHVLLHFQREWYRRGI